jgi:hypothetical protein
MVVATMFLGDSVAQDSPAVNVTGNDNVVSVGQIGGITARTVTIVEQALRPEFRILQRQDSDMPDGSHVVALLGDVKSPITPGLLVIEIQASNLRNVTILPPPTGGVSTMSLRNKIVTANSFHAEIPAPRGQYVITIATAKATDISLGASF